MEDFKPTWATMPRWERGLIIGNVYYLMIGGVFLLLTFNQGYDQAELNVIFMPFLGVMLGAYLQPIEFLYYAAWCLCSMLIVQRFGEVIGTVVLFFVLVILGAVSFLYAFSHIQWIPA